MLLSKLDRAAWFDEKLVPLASKNKKLSSSLRSPIILSRRVYIESEMQLPKMTHVEINKVIKGKLGQINPFQEPVDFVYYIFSREKNKINLLVFLFPSRIMDKFVKRDAFFIPETLLLYKSFKGDGVVEVKRGDEHYLAACSKGRFYSSLISAKSKNVEMFLHRFGLPEDLPELPLISTDWQKSLSLGAGCLSPKAILALFVNFSLRNTVNKRVFIKQACISACVLAAVFIAYLVLIETSLNNRLESLESELGKRSSIIKDQIKLQDSILLKEKSITSFNELLKESVPATRSLIVVNRLASKFPEATISTVKTSDRNLFVLLEAQNSSDVLTWLNEQKEVSSAVLSRDLKTLSDGRFTFEVNVLFKLGVVK